MNPQAGPSSQKPTVVKPGRPGEPPLVSNPISLKERVALYLRHYTGDLPLVQRMVFLKTGRETPGIKGDFKCNEAEQNKILHDVMTKFHENSWDFTAKNVGKYIASGLTQVSDLNLVTGFAEEASTLAGFDKPIDPSLIARLTKKEEIDEGAEERLLENRAAFPQETEIGDQLRKGKQGLYAPPPLTPDQLAAHHNAVGLAALDLIMKKK